MKTTNEQKPQVTESSGSAENKGQSREEQKNRNFNLDDKAKNDLANQIGEDKSDIAGLAELGADSGRDDYAGGDNDGMTAQNTDQPTDR